jgi:hypothetical protein
MVGDTIIGDDVLLTDAFEMPAMSNHEFPLQIFVGREVVDPDAVNGRTGVLVGHCFNDDLEWEAIRSFPFRLSCTTDEGSPVLFESVSRPPEEFRFDR